MLIFAAVHNEYKLHHQPHTDLTLLLCTQNRDESAGGDGWAVKQGWVSVTPLGLRSDIVVRSEVRHCFVNV